MITRKDILIKGKKLHLRQTGSFLPENYYPTMNTINRTKNRPTAIETLLSLASLSLVEKDLCKAQGYYKKALRLAKASNAPVLAVQPLLGLSSIALNENNDHQARSYYRLALQIANRANSEDIQKEVFEFKLH